MKTGPLLLVSILMLLGTDSSPGAEAESHMTHPRHLAEVWQALDAAR